MAINSAISWTDHTWNIARGCHKVYDRHPATGEKVSECEFCYMYRGANGIHKFDPEQVRQTSKKSGGVFNLPLRLPKTPAKVFTSSLTDVFHKDIDPFRDDMWAIIRRTPHLTYQILTKRPQNIASRLPADWGNGYKNVWLGVSAGYQHTADKRIPILLDVPAGVHFVSAEPLLERITLARYLPLLDWVVIGGESGNDVGAYRYRPCELEWIEKIVTDCQASKTAVWVKQLGRYQKFKLGLVDKAGQNRAEWPAHLQIQEFPNVSQMNRWKP